MNESLHNINRPSETEFVNSGSFSLSRCSVRSATSKVNPTDRQTQTSPTPRQDGRQKQALINELLIQASKNIG
jgi:hypothetical protein